METDDGLFRQAQSQSLSDTSGALLREDMIPAAAQTKTETAQNCSVGKGAQRRAHAYRNASIEAVW